MRKYLLSVSTMGFFLCAFFLSTLVSSCSDRLSPKDIVGYQGVRIDYTDTRKGDTTLVFVHGWCINKTYWSDQVDFFSKRYRVVTVDLPGFGKSGKNRASWTVEAFGSDIDSVLSGLNLKNTVLVGHSMAGDIVLQAALHAPGRVIGLVGVDNFKSISPQTADQKAEDDQAIGLLKNNFSQVASQFFQQYLFYKTTPEPIRKRVLADVALADSAVAIACMDQPPYDEIKSLNAFGRTLYLINSDYTSTDTSALIVARVPYLLFTVHDTGHFPMVEKPAEFNRSLEEIMTALPSRLP